MSDTSSIPPGDPPPVNETLPPGHPFVMHVPPGTFAAWEADGELIERVNNPITPVSERVRYWWDELIAVATRSDGPLPRSGMIRKNGLLDRTTPRAVEAIRDKYALELVGKMALALVEAGLAPLVQSLSDEIGGRRIVLPLLKQAVYIADRHPSELAADSELNDRITDLLNNKNGAQRTLADIRDKVLNATPSVSGGKQQADLKESPTTDSAPRVQATTYNPTDPPGNPHSVPPTDPATAPSIIPSPREGQPLKPNSAVWVSRCDSLLCSPDYGTVRRGAETFTFTDTQKACVKFMVEAWEKGRREFSNQELLDAVGSTGNYIRDVFRSNGKVVTAWKNLIVEADGKKGRYTLRLTSNN